MQANEQQTTKLPHSFHYPQHHEVKKLAITHIHTNAHTHTHLTQLTHFRPSTKWYTYIISHSQMCFYAAHIHSVNVSIICQCDCCWFHNTVLSATTPRHSSVFGVMWCVTVLFYLPGPELRLSVCQCVLTPAALSHSLLALFYLSAALLKKYFHFLRCYRSAMPLNSDKHMFSSNNGWN